MRRLILGNIDKAHDGLYTHYTGDIDDYVYYDSPKNFWYYLLPPAAACGSTWVMGHEWSLLHDDEIESVRKISKCPKKKVGEKDDG